MDNLKGSKIFLRPMILSDAEKVVEWRNNKNILKWMFKKNKISVKDHIKWFNSRVNRHDYIVLDKKNLKPIGTVNYVLNSKNKFEAEAGKLIGDQNYWGKGYAKEAFKIWIKFGFNNLSLNKIIVKTNVKNVKNIGLNLSLGFEKIKIINKDDNEILLMRIIKGEK